MSLAYYRGRFFGFLIFSLSGLHGGKAFLAGAAATVAAAPFFMAFTWYWHDLRGKAVDDRWRGDIPLYVFAFLTSQAGAIAYRLCTSH